jgi:hypothetical protein
VRDEASIMRMLDKFKRFQEKQKLIEEMHGEICALEWVLGKRNNLF